MERAEQQEIHEFLSVEPVGRLFKKIAVEILARESDIENLGELSAKEKLEALRLFKVFLGELTGWENQFLHGVEIDNEKQRRLEEYIYNVQQ
jgi:hypothetical protein